MFNIYYLLLSWLPTAGMRLAFAGLIAIIIIFIVLRIVKLVLDSLPFL